jgi:hypothetical protein
MAYLDSVVPQWGPIAGGTELTIRGGFFGDATNASVLLGDSLMCQVSKEKR